MIDVYPTILEAAGVKPRNWIDGLSLLRLIRGEQKSVREFGFYGAHGGPIHVTDGRYTLFASDPKSIQRPGFQESASVTGGAVRQRAGAGGGDVQSALSASAEGGWLDYSENAVAAFRAWLKDKHGTIATLNGRWGTKYASFDAITPPPGATITPREATQPDGMP